ncbi:penicillin-binding transpeptidase domain-containing protein, partial [Bariatricus massiliensis]|nr:penicillin-binding transpeptidase domain-containing protein [Bariatricus massiliensis]
KNNKLVETLATKKVENGKDIKLTIDADLQQSLYKEYQNDKSASVAMNPKTGEILALVSTPSFSSNDFIF